MMEAMEALALVSGRVEEELLVRNEYLAAENRILKSKLKKPVSFNDSERSQLAKVGKLTKDFERIHGPFSPRKKSSG